MSPLRGPYSYQPSENGLAPKDVRIVELRAELWPDDSRRVRVHLELTPFLEKPDVEVIIAQQDDSEVARINIIESIDDKMTFTMHIRSQTLEEVYKLKASVAYTDIGIVDQKSISFEAPVSAE